MSGSAVAARGKAISGRTLAPLAHLSCDVVVVGTGAGGSMLAHDLARAGLHVIALERGSILGPADMTTREADMLPRLFAEGGARTTDDLAITVLQGMGVGGSTLHNTNLCRSLAPEILTDWRERLGLPLGGFEDDAAAVESLLGVRAIPDDQINANNAVFRRGVEALGYRGGRLRHNRDEQCRQSGFCELGCPNDGKRNAARVLVPAFLEAGGTVIADVRVDRIITRDGRATGVEARVFDPLRNRSIGDLTVQASAVVLAASATGSAALHERSGIPDPMGFAGRNLRLHPGAPVIGLHEERIEGWRGVPQSWECTEFLDLAHDADRRVWLVSAFTHPAMTAGLIPGVGAAHASLMRTYARTSAAVAMVHDTSSGRVRAADGDAVQIRYALSRDDRAQLALGLREAGRILLAGGATRVLIPFAEPRFYDSPDALDAITAADIEPLSPALTAVHPMGTLRMGRDASEGVTDPEGRHFHLERLYVADGSLFPTSIGGPPQIPIYTMGRRVARTVLADAS